MKLDNKFIKMERSILEQVKERINQHGMPEKITELCLDQILISKFSPDMNKIIQNCQNVEHLSLASCQLIFLNNFPKLSKLRYLDLQQNRFEDKALVQLLSQLQRLEGLNLSKNKINKLDSIIQCVKKLSIKQINIFQTKIFQSSSNIIEILFQHCKTLQCINWEDRGGKQVKAESQFQSENSSQSNGNYEEESISPQSSKKIKIQ